MTPPRTTTIQAALSLTACLGLGLAGCVTSTVQELENGSFVDVNVQQTPESQRPTNDPSMTLDWTAPTGLSSAVPDAVAQFTANAKKFEKDSTAPSASPILRVADSQLQTALLETPSVAVGDEIDPQLVNTGNTESLTADDLPTKWQRHVKYDVAKGEYVVLTTPPEKISPAPAAEAATATPSTLNAEPAINTLSFATALGLVSGQNPRVAFAQERINEAFARLDAANALWLPSLRAGASYNKHEGSIQEVGGNVFDVSRGSAYTGFGAEAVGTGSPAVSGLSVQFHLADAIFQPLIAERTAAARQHAADATTNDVLLDAALAYLELLRAVAAHTIADETLKNARQLAEQTATFAKSGQGPQADADRAQTELALRQNDVTRAEEAIQIASARLAEVLSLDATLDLRPAEPTITPIELVPLDSSLNDLTATALSNRPELSESRLMVSAALQRLKRERNAPLVPSVLLGLSYGGFGGGIGGDVDHFRDRLDFDAVAFWEVRNFGLGERAARDEAHAQVHQAKHRDVRLMDQVAREVAESYAQVQSRKKQIAVAEKGLKAAGDSYRRNLERIRNGQGLPIEVLQSIQALDQAGREHLRAKTDYNSAQFRLHRALGWPINQR